MNVIFEEQQPATLPISSARGIVRWMLQKHIVTTKTQGQIVLLLVVSFTLVLSLFIGRSTISNDKVDPHKNFVPAVIR